MTTLEWTLEFKAAAVDVWAVIADTDAFNRAAGLDFSFERVDGVMRGTTSIAGIKSEWIETPISWQTPNHFESNRVYDSGPVRRAVARCTLSEHPRGTTVHYRVDLEARNILMRLPVQVLATTLIRPGLFRALEAASAAIRGEVECYDPPPDLSIAALAELENGLSPVEAPVAQALRQRILHTPLAIQHRLRPLQIAEEDAPSHRCARPTSWSRCI